MNSCGKGGLIHTLLALLFNNMGLQNITAQAFLRTPRIRKRPTDENSGNVLSQGEGARGRRVLSFLLFISFLVLLVYSFIGYIPFKDQQRMMMPSNPTTPFQQRLDYVEGLIGDIPSSFFWYPAPFLNQVTLK